MLEAILSIASLAKDAYDVISAIRNGDPMEPVIKELQKLNTNVEKLGDHIYYAPTIQQVKDTSRENQRILTDLRDVRQYLEPVQKAVGGDILSSSMIITPELMRQSMHENPWHVLVDIQPVDSVKPHSNPDMVPILFDHDGVSYIGWQLRGTLPLLFNCQYDPELHLLKPAANKGVQSVEFREPLNIHNTAEQDSVQERGPKFYLGLIKGFFRLNASDENTKTNPKAKSTLQSKSRAQSTKLASNAYNRITINNIESLCVVNEISLNSSVVESFALSADRTILAIRNKNTISLHNIEDGQLICDVNHTQVKGCVFSPDNTYIATWGEVPGKSDIHLWNVKNGSLVLTISTKNIRHKIDKIIFSPDEQSIVVGSQGDIQLFNLSSGQLSRDLHGMRKLIGFYPRLYDVLVLLVTGSDTVELWNATNGLQLINSLQISSKLTRLTGPISNLLFSPVSDHVVVLYKSGEGALYSIKNNSKWNKDWEFFPYRLSDRFEKISKCVFPPYPYCISTLAYISRGRAGILLKSEPSNLLFPSSGALGLTYSFDSNQQSRNLDLSEGPFEGIHNSSQDQELLAVQYADRRIRLYNNHNMSLLRTIEEDGVVLSFMSNKLITGLASVHSRSSKQLLTATWKIWQVT